MTQETAQTDGATEISLKPQRHDCRTMWITSEEGDEESECEQKKRTGEGIKDFPQGVATLKASALQAGWGGKGDTIHARLGEKNGREGQQTKLGEKGGAHLVRST